VAAAKPLPISPEMPAPATAPTIATPSVAPTCRLVEATAAATPACEGGIPETAVLVIGGLTSPKPNPNTEYAPRMYAGEVSADIRVSITAATGSAAPATTNGPREPWRPTIRPDRR